MFGRRRRLGPLLLCSLAFTLQPALAAPPAKSSAPPAGPPQAAARDGSHDFDFEFGTWKTHLKRRLNPLTGSTNWVEYDGTSVLRKVWDGSANLGEIDLEGPAGHIEGMSLRLYNPTSRLWSVYFATSKGGVLGEAMVGGFANGRGEFYNQESFNGRSIFVRFIFSDITPKSFRLEQAFSDDGGKTWEANWVSTFTR